MGDAFARPRMVYARLEVPQPQSVTAVTDLGERKVEAHTRSTAALVKACPGHLPHWQPFYTGDRLCAYAVRASRTPLPMGRKTKRCPMKQERVEFQELLYECIEPVTQGSCQ